MIYDFLKSDDHFAPTFGRSLLLSLLGLMGDSITGGRVKGLSDSLFSRKRKLSQRAPLSVEQFVQLEETLFGDASTADKVAAGFFVFMLFARARYSDALSVASMEIDELEGGAFRFVEAQASRTKTSITLQEKPDCYLWQRKRFVFQERTGQRRGLTSESRKGSLWAATRRCCVRPWKVEDGRNFL